MLFRTGQWISLRCDASVLTENDKGRNLVTALAGILRGTEGRRSNRGVRPGYIAFGSAFVYSTLCKCRRWSASDSVCDTEGNITGESAACSGHRHEAGSCASW